MNRVLTPCYGSNEMNQGCRNSNPTTHSHVHPPRQGLYHVQNDPGFTRWMGYDSLDRWGMYLIIDLIRGQDTSESVDNDPSLVARGSFYVERTNIIVCGRSEAGVQLSLPPCSGDDGYNT